MREIKFRAWDGESMHKAFDLTQNPHYWWKDNHDYPLMQYTGLTDKNGVEIYEGDIVRTYHPFSKFDYNDEKDFIDGEWLCVWEAPRFIFKPINDIGIGMMTKLGGDLTVIIGNIYENPELLEKETP